MSKALEAFRTISEVADDLDVPKHVLRFWEVKFPQIKPMKRGGGRRYYRPEDLVLLRGIQRLLHAEGYTIKGVQKILREQGIEQVKVHGLAAIEAATKATAAAKPGAKSAAGAKSPVTARVRALPKSLSRDRENGGSQDPRALRATISAVILELQACRAVLEGLAPLAAPMPRPAPEPRRSKAARSSR